MISEEKYKKRLKTRGLSGYNVQVPLDVQTFSNFEKDKEIIASDFAEGSESLKKLLLIMWEKGIKTNACCAGHEKEIFNVPYIQFFASKNLNFNFFNKILKYLAKEFGEYAFLDYSNEELDNTAIEPKVCFQLGKDAREWWADNLNRRELADKFFEIIYNCFVKEKNIFIENENFEISFINYFKKIKQKTYVEKFILNRLMFKKENYIIWFNKKFAEMYFPEQKSNINKLLNDEISKYSF